MDFLTLRTRQARVSICRYGARMASIETPDRNGIFGHILLGFEDVAGFMQAGGAFGAVLGRYANRIAGACFALDGRIYPLAGNDNGNILHGGDAGFGNREWTLETFTEGEIPELALTLTSADGDQGFPGTLRVRATYRLEGASLQLELSAHSDAPTVINLSAHPYFNLAGSARRDVFDHRITLNADFFLPTDAAQIPTGRFQPVAGTPFDFRQPKTIGPDIAAADPQLLIARGYDHCFVLNKFGQAGAQLAARAFDPSSGRGLELYTTQPGLQFYSGNSLDGHLAGRGGVALRQSSGFAFEAQNFPDAPNHPNFPCSILRPGEAYRQTILYKFSAA